MSIYIQSDVVLERILSIEGDENVSHIEHQVQMAKKGKSTVIHGANFEAKYVVSESGEVLYSGRAGNKWEDAIEHGFSTTF